MSDKPAAKKLQGKKILYVVTQTKWGGAQKYVLQLAKYFSRENQVDIAYGQAQPDKLFIEQAKKLNIGLLPVKNLVRNFNAGKELSAIGDLSKILRMGRYQLVHLNSSKAGLLGAIAAQIYNYNPLNTRLRVIYTAHGFVFNEPLVKIERQLYILSERFSTGLQTAVITVSEFDRQSAIDHKICAQRKIFAIHNGLDFAEYQFYTREEAREKLQLDKQKKYFGSIGSFYNTKGYPFLVEAVKLLADENSPLLSDHCWLIIGDGPEQKNIEEKIKRNDLEKYFRIIVPENNDWKYLKAFDYFILPSVKEGLPYTILEAGLAGVPIIASKVGGVPEILTDEKTGLLVTPANPLALAEAIKKIANQPQLATELIRANEHNIRTKFSLAKTLAETEKLYLKLF